MTTSERSERDILSSGLVFRFADWPNPEVPNGQAGVYTVWRREDFLHVGMAGRGMPAASAADRDIPAPRGMRGLRGTSTPMPSDGGPAISSASTYVFDRLVLPALKPLQIKEAGAGRLSLDGVVRAFIREHLAYRYVLAPDGASALVLDRSIQKMGSVGTSRR